jgi:gas vesicle protein
MTQYQYTGENSAAIKADIERTRTNMSQKIDAIQERFQPEHLKQQTQDVVRSAMQDGTEAVVDYLREHAEDFSGSLIDTIKRNPVPSALIGLGVGMLIYENFNHSNKGNGYKYPRYSERYDSGYGQGGYPQSYTGSGAAYRDETQRYYATSTSSLQDNEEGGLGERMREGMENVREGVNDVAERVGNQLQDVGEQITDYGSEGKHRVSQVGKQAQHMVEANPLGVGLAALAVGAVLGLAFPATRRENRMMGEWRDQMVDKAKHKASDVAHRVQEVVQEVKPELNEIANRVIDDVAETGKNAVSEVKDSVQRVTSA